MGFIGNKSNELNQDVLHGKICQIFELLDVQGKGSIEATSIDINTIPIDLLQVLMPLLIELETYDEKLDKGEFVQSVLALYKTLTITEKNAIRNFGRKKI